ncbi:hypothetical protein VNO77_42850 [Canavalia gladiata]|uniref:Uncharacterized protein n=1 Tax=Canavalia gladiata TaxID=3824 RepID=A0AAN9PNY4_CANGL
MENGKPMSGPHFHVFLAVEKHKHPFTIGFLVSLSLLMSLSLLLLKTLLHTLFSHFPKQKDTLGERER